MIFRCAWRCGIWAVHAAADVVARHVLAAWGHRESAADMRLFLAVEEALAGCIPAALQHLQAVAIRKDVAYDRDLLAIAKALVEFQQAEPGEACWQFKVVQAQLSVRFTPADAEGDERCEADVSPLGKSFAAQGGSCMDPPLVWLEIELAMVACTSTPICIGPGNVSTGIVHCIADVAGAPSKKR